MTRIDFYIHVEDPVAVACQLLGKAYARGLRVHVLTADAAMSDALDRHLWVNPVLGFLPHCRLDDPLADRTPVHLDHEVREPRTDQLLLNLHPERPPFFARFQRLMEIVSRDDGDRARARERFRHYRDRGYDIHSHDLGAAQD